MAAPVELDQQFVMLRTAMHEKIFEYIGRKQSSGEWVRRLPELAKRLEDVLYTKFSNRNDYYNMMKGPVEPQLQFAIKTLSTQNQQNQQNPQMARETTSSSFATMTPVGNHHALCQQSASLLADTQTNNADECARTDTGLLQHQRIEDMAALSGVDGQFVMLRTAMNEKIFEYIGKRQKLAQWQKRLPKLAKMLEEVLYTKFPNRNDYYNMMKGPIEPPLLYVIKTLSAQNQQNQQNPQMARDTASSSATMTPDVNLGDLCEQFASLLADAQNNNADELDGAQMTTAP
ncbi:unnamed protein product [Urochloa decumbens]|uniref:Uncharacterized protein n=1 Tax=Urochloa decumbens TaxID=240449 RepID=A0ABC9A7L6_9POAL